jgi:hypothetical protein
MKRDELRGRLSNPELKEYWNDFNALFDQLETAEALLRRCKAITRRLGYAALERDVAEYFAKQGETE